MIRPWVVPDGPHQLSDTASRGQNNPDTDLSPLAQIGFWKLFNKRCYLFVGQNAGTLDILAAHISFAEQFDGAVLDNFPLGRKSKHLLEIRQEYVGGAQLAFSFDGIEYRQNIGLTHIDQGNIAQMRKHSALKLFTHKLPPVPAANTFAVPAEMWC